MWAGVHSFEQGKMSPFRNGESKRCRCPLLVGVGDSKKTWTGVHSLQGLVTQKRCRQAPTPCRGWQLKKDMDRRPLLAGVGDSKKMWTGVGHDESYKRCAMISLGLQIRAM